MTPFTVADAEDRIPVRVEGRTVVATLVGVDSEGRCRIEYPNGKRATVKPDRVRRAS